MDRPVLHDDRDKLVKFWIFGEKGVGKSALVQKFVGANTRSTSEEKMKIASWNDWHPWEKDCVINGEKVKILLLVCNRLPPADDECVFHYRYKGDGYIFIYDVTNLESFEKCYRLLEHIAPYVPLMIALLGNKCDLVKERQVSSHRSLSFPAGVHYMETSTHDQYGRNVEEVFTNLAQKVLRERVMESGNSQASIATDQSPLSRSKRYTLSLSRFKRKEKKKKVTASISSHEIVDNQTEDFDTTSSQQHSVENLEEKLREITLECEALKQKNYKAELMIENLHQQLFEATDQQKGPAPDSMQAGSSWSIDKSEIEITDHQLGVGGWATVKIALFRGLRVAAKQMHNIILTPYNNRLFVREMNIAASIRHPNLVQFIGAATEGSPIILTELMETSLRAVLEDPSKTLSKRQALLICGDIAKALNYLHLTKPHAIIHRDVSSANILLERLADEKWRAKLSDYGSVNFVQMVTTKAPGCVAYAAPESLSPAMQSPKMDVFSYGVLMVEIFSCQFPAPDHRDELIRDLQSNHQYAELVPLINQCINIDPQTRPDMIGIIANLNND